MVLELAAGLVSTSWVGILCGVVGQAGVANEKESVPKKVCCYLFRAAMAYVWLLLSGIFMSIVRFRLMFNRRQQQNNVPLLPCLHCSQQQDQLT